MRNERIISRAAWLSCSLAVLLAFSPAHADSTAKVSAPGHAGAVLDVRVTVLPTLALQLSAERLRVESNAGDVALQWSRGPGRGTQLRAQREVVTHVLSSGPGAVDLVTVASP